MKITVEKIKDWDLVYKVALYTQGKTPAKKYPSEKWKKQTVIAQHSVLRQLEFLVTIEDVPNFIHNHLVRHVHMEKYIRTMREDLTGIPNKDITRETWNNGTYVINAQEIIQISRDRLCYKASPETQYVWNKVVDEIEKIEPLLAKMCVEFCVYCGYCKEYKTCGAYKDWKNNKRIEYLNFVNGEES